MKDPLDEPQRGQSMADCRLIVQLCHGSCSKDSVAGETRSVRCINAQWYAGVSDYSNLWLEASFLMEKGDQIQKSVLINPSSIVR